VSSSISDTEYFFSVKTITDQITSTTATDLIFTKGNPIDLAINGPQARNLGFNGSGIKIGIISDTFYPDPDVFTGPLPFNVTVLDNPLALDYPGNLNAPYNGEGRAMAETIHAIAPGASIYFCTGGSNGAVDQQSMVSAIATLQNAGCSIIVDDLGWAGEPNTGSQTEQAIESVVGGVNLSTGEAGGPPIVYFVAAGNTNLEPVISGHSLDPAAITVGAVNWLDTPFFGQQPPISAPYSSPAPVPYVKPDISAPDLGPSSFPVDLGKSFNAFLGTSASAPAAAAVAALMMQANKELQSSPDAIRQLLKQSSISFGGDWPPLSGPGGMLV
jgi:hypothetical protein